MVPGGGRVDVVTSMDAAASTPPPPPPDNPALAASHLQPANKAAPSANAPEQQRKAKKKKDKPVPTLDFFSPEFDPLLALNTQGLRPPIPDAPPLISIQMCRPLLPDTHPAYKPPTAKPATAASTTTTLTSAHPPTIHTPPHPPPTNPLTLFTTAPARPPRQHVQALLAELVRTQCRCRVLLRQRGALHGVLTGQLRAFDRHVNMYVADAQQVRRVVGKVRVWERQRVRSAEGRRRWVWVEVVREVEVWERVWVGQMLVRGESVFSVSRCSDASDAADFQITGIGHDDGG